MQHAVACCISLHLHGLQHRQKMYKVGMMVSTV